ncbi:PIG-L deacetylase family protein [Cohnella nanjingensis]|uniref:PIG-L family deacetylase n=1 Tax=Cohnella nanjingensis TaxID=1387779 RepID=A0A7X0VHD3_9BACL|nr:PIG-L deacetylase family protein [Cohnella nanjingensis]MBB6674047.1 PIG-L family deacetylase [Cohnella nanjingensis]
MSDRLNILVILAHPDDETGCGGTLARLARAGHRITAVVATDGSRGTQDRQMRPERLAAIRREEMREACRRLGVREVHFLDYEDGTLREQPDLGERLFRVIRIHRPDIAITLDGWRRWELHPDHRALGQLAAEACYLADSVWYYPEHEAMGIAPWKPRELLLFWTEEPNLIVDVSSTAPVRRHAADAHVSQGSPDATFGEKYERWYRSAFPAEAALEEERFRKLFGSELALEV